uniref:Uncharacterized protein n=1 Tax=Anguilla anguilla TaxID=7936 RepID=A0A0E9WS65_ANGAN
MEHTGEEEEQAGKGNRTGRAGRSIFIFCSGEGCCVQINEHIEVFCVVKSVFIFLFCVAICFVLFL